MNVLIDTLRARLGTAHVLTDTFDIAPYCSDWRGRYAGQPLCVVKPGSAAEAATTVQACLEANVAIVPQGGNTGLVGGSIPGGPGQVVVSTRRLTSHGSIDVSGRQVTVGAGTTVAEVHDLVAPSGLMYGIDLASRDSATMATKSGFSTTP